MGGAAHLATWVRQEATPAYRRIHARVAPITRSLPWIAAVETVLVAGLAAVAGQLIWLAVAPQPWTDGGTSPIAQERPAAPSLGVLTSFDAFHRAVTAVTAASVRAPETMLNLQLFGIRSDSGPGKGSAIIATPDGKQDVYFVGQEIMAQVRLEAIFSDRVTIRRNGVAETLSFAKDPGRAPAAVPAVAPAAPQEVRRRIDLDFTQLIAQARLTPRDGGGLTLEGSADADALKQAGLEPGDVILSVNGTPLNDLAALVSIAATGGARFLVEIDRKGQRNIHSITVDR